RLQKGLQAQLRVLRSFLGRAQSAPLLSSSWLQLLTLTDSLPNQTPSYTQGYLDLCVSDHADNGFLGVLKGIGKPGIGALAFFFGYCLAAFPIGVPLMFPAKFGIKGHTV
ncbi:unnamed protein product, partial [Ranitomeya imitator]